MKKKFSPICENFEHPSDTSKFRRQVGADPRALLTKLAHLGDIFTKQHNQEKTMHNGLTQKASGYDLTPNSFEDRLQGRDHS